ncbi:MAG: hexose kinase [Phycisphaerales bacterium]|nr:hexose kinase [Phycisphaerales bacterium]
MIFLGTTPAVQLTMIFSHLTMNEVNRAQRTQRSASGKSPNAARVARTIARQEEVLALGFAGGDTGLFLRYDLDQAGINHDLLEVAPATRTCVTLIEPDTRRTTELVEESAALPASAYESLLQHLDHHLPGHSVLVLSGSLPPQSADDFYARCVKLARQHQAQVIIDGRGQPLIQALAEKPDIVKLNVSELAQTVEVSPGAIQTGEKAIVAAARQLIKRGAGQVVTTRGADAVITCNAENAWRLLLPKVQALNPIGSGDAFAGGMAVALQRGQSFQQACLIGAACGIANTLLPVSGFLDPQLIEPLMKQITIEPLE